MFPFQHLPVLQANQAIENLSPRRNNDSICDSLRSRGIHWISQPLQHLLLAGFVESDGIEMELSMCLVDDGYCGFDLGVGEGVEWVRRVGGASDVVSD